MANNYIKFSEAPEATDAQMTDAGLVGVSIVDANSSTGFSTRKSPLSKLANYVLNKFNTLSLGGATQTVKSAIDSIADGFGHLVEYIIGDTDMGTTADTITGAIAEHESDITSLNSSLGRLTAKAGSVLAQQQNLTTSPATVTCNSISFNTGSVFTLVSSDGGFRCSRQGMVRVTGYIHVTGVTSGDEISLAAGVYSGGWVYQTYSMRSKTVTVSIDIFVPVSENQIVYIRAANNSGARGAIDSAQLAVEWLSA